MRSEAGMAIDSRVKGLETAVFTLIITHRPRRAGNFPEAPPIMGLVLIMPAFCARCDCSGVFLEFFFGSDGHQCHVGGSIIQDRV